MPISYYKKLVPFMKNLMKMQNNENYVKNLWKCQPGTNFLEIDCDGRLRYCSYLNDLIDPTLTIFDLDKGYYRIIQSRLNNMLNYCNSRCFANCFYQVSWIRYHPLKFFKDVVLGHFSHFINEMDDAELYQHKEQAKTHLRQKYGNKKGNN